MKLIILLTVFSALLLAGFLIIRPALSEIGKPTAPDTTGQARVPVPAGVTRPALATDPSVSLPHTGATSRPRPARPTSAAAAAAGIIHPEEIEQAILELTNKERAIAQLKPLSGDDLLREAARGMSDDMLMRNFWSHIDPDGLEPQDRIAISHRKLISVSTAENIYKATNLTAPSARELAAKIVQGWMESEGHRRNILRAEFTHLGVGVSVKGGELRATQDFAQTFGFTDENIPLQVSQGERLNLQATAADGRKAEQYTFYSLDRGTKEGGTQSIAEGKVTVGAGRYELMFYFPDGAGNRTGYLGMQVEVK